jgi:hypothetical protein
MTLEKYSTAKSYYQSSVRYEKFLSCLVLVVYMKRVRREDMLFFIGTASVNFSFALLQRLRMNLNQSRVDCWSAIFLLDEMIMKQTLREFSWRFSCFSFKESKEKQLRVYLAFKGLQNINELWRRKFEQREICLEGLVFYWSSVRSSE